jgi:hypothetical protein
MMTRSSARNSADWQYAAILGGFVGTVAAGLVMLVGYVEALFLAEAIPGEVGEWFARLTRNPATELVRGQLALALLLHFAVGVMLSLLYAAFFEPRLTGPGWLRGLLFSLLPWALSLVLFLPLVGGGFLGSALGAGPLPLIGNLIPHLAYGAVLGWLYARDLRELADDPVSARANAGAERGIAVGVVGGGLLGGVAGYVVGGVWGGAGSPELTAFLGAALGATCAGFVGSFVGLTQPEG